MAAVEFVRGNRRIVLADKDSIDEMTKSHSPAYKAAIGRPGQNYNGFGPFHVLAYENDGICWHTVVEIVEGWSGPVHAHSGVCIESLLAFIAGPFAVGVDMRSGNVQWQQKGDEFGSCFALYDDKERECLIVHGEIEITRLNMKGDVIWRTSGYDIFTGPFVLDGDVIYATDFYENTYRINMDTGENILVQRGTEYSER
jgi:hypothetical protein